MNYLGGQNRIRYIKTTGCLMFGVGIKYNNTDGQTITYDFEPASLPKEDFDLLFRLSHPVTHPDQIKLVFYEKPPDYYHCTNPNQPMPLNGYTCDDGSSGYCASDQKCYATEPFEMGEWDLGCQSKLYFCFFFWLWTLLLPYNTKLKLITCFANEFSNKSGNFHFTANFWS